jgi:hypothetical protein
VRDAKLEQVRQARAALGALLDTHRVVRGSELIKETVAMKKTTKPHTVPPRLGPPKKR